MTIPNNLRIPILSAEFDPTNAFQGPSILPYKVLLMGQLLGTGSKAANLPFLVSSVAQAQAFFGIGSQLAVMFAAWFANNRTTQVYGLGLSDDGAAVAATGTLTLTGSATAAGTLVAYVGGVRVTAAVASGDSVTVQATALKNAINAITTLPVTAGNASGVLTITARNKGPQGNDIDFRLNYNEGEVLPAGTTAVIVAMASGATAPVLTTAITNLGDSWFQIIAAPYNDATSLTAIETELLDRAGPIRMIDGLYVTSRTGNLSSQTTFGTGRNCQFVTCIDANKIPNTPMEVAAAYAAQLSLEGSKDPGRPFQTLPLAGILAPAITDRRPVLDNNTLLYDGISTFTVDQAGAVRIQRAITMYQLNASSVADIAYLDVTTILTLMYLRYDFRLQFQLTFPRAKLANDGAIVPPGQSIVTPKIAKAKAVAIFRTWFANLALVEDPDQFANDLVVIRNVSDPNRLDFILPPNLINGFIVGAITIKFLI